MSNSSEESLTEFVAGGGSYVDAHFEISKNLHVGRFYYVQKYLQDTLNTGKVAVRLKDAITKSLGEVSDTTLIGFCDYSSLTLSQTVSLLDPDGSLQVNYAVLEGAGNDYSFVFNPKLQKKAIIILTVTTTFRKYFLCRHFLLNYAPGLMIEDHFFSIFLALQPHLAEKLVLLSVDDQLQISRQPILVRDLYQPYNWVSISRDEVSLQVSRATMGTNSSLYTAHFLTSLPSDIHAADKCTMCFPLYEGGARDEDVLDEKPIIKPLHNDSLNIIFETPAFAGRGDVDAGKTFNEVFAAGGGQPVHLYGHLEQFHCSFLHYIQSDIFYDYNRQAILKFFDDQLADFRKAHQGESVVIVTAEHAYRSRFIDELVNAKILGDNEIKIISFQPFAEFLENFIHYNQDTIQKASAIFFVDDVVAGGNTFKLISDFLKNAVAENGKFEHYPRGFDFVLTLIDRSTKYGKAEIKRKLAVKAGARAPGKFIAYYNLFVPQIDSTHKGNPIVERDSSLRRILKASHLDALKLLIEGEIAKGNARSITKLKEEYRNPDQLKYFPFINSPEEFVFYRDCYTFARRNLLKLEIFHDVSDWLQTCSEFNESNRKKMFWDILSPDKLAGYFNIPEQNRAHQHRNIKLERAMVFELLLKVLVRHPFSYYRGISETIFIYNNRKLFELLKKLSGNNKTETAPGFKKIDFEDFRKLRMHIKRSVELNANFIFSDYFLSELKEYFGRETTILWLLQRAASNFHHEDKAYRERYMRNFVFQSRHLVTFKYFLLSCYKSLVFNNPARSLILEALLNLPRLKPDSFQGESGYDDYRAMKKLLNDAYYQLHRILVSENSYFLDQLIREQQTDKFVYRIINGNMAAWHGGTFTLEKFKDLVLDMGVSGTRGDSEVYAATTRFLQMADNDVEYLRSLAKVTDAVKEPRELIEALQKLIIERYYFYRYFNDIHPDNADTGQFKMYLVQSDRWRSAMLNADISSSIRTMLFTLALINNYKSARRFDGADIRENFLREIRRILDSATEIMGKNLDYGFFIEYRKRRGEDDTDNIYAILSDEEGENLNIRLDPRGLIYQMMEGVTDHADGNLQTFIALARLPDARILAMQREYFTSTGGRPKAKAQIAVKDAILYDDREGDIGTLLTKRAKMLLLFRLSLPNPPATGGAAGTKGRAVLVISSEEDPTPDNFRNFANMEKTRLLLLIKEQLLGYLQSQFENDALISVLGDKKIKDLRVELNHGIGNYVLALHEYQHTILSSTEMLLGKGIYPPQITKMRTAAIMNYTVVNAIVGQAHLVNKWGQDMVPVDASFFKEQLVCLFEDPDLGKKAVFSGEFELPDQLPDKLPHPLYYVIIPELVINMKKYSPDYENPELSIRFEPGKFIFRNRVGITQGNEYKQGGGRVMCDLILHGIKLPPLSIHKEEVKGIAYHMVTLFIV